jgi:hypothetical protein
MTPDPTAGLWPLFKDEALPTSVVSVGSMMTIVLYLGDKSGVRLMKKCME